MFKHGFGSYMVGNMNMCFAEICLSCWWINAVEVRENWFYEMNIRCFACSCKGRYRGSETSRGDIDDALGK
jgi:hypothetical protein